EEDSDDLRALMQGLLARRPKLPVNLKLADRAVELVAGNPVVLGRSDGELKVPSPVVSRRHLEFSRRDGNDAWGADLGPRNGTTLRVVLFDKLPIGGGLDLLLGTALPLKVWPSEFSGLIVQLPGRVCWLPLGPVRIGRATIAFEASGDG